MTNATEILLMVTALLGICVGVLLLSVGLLIGEWGGAFAGLALCGGGVLAITRIMDRD